MSWWSERSGGKPHIQRGTDTYSGEKCEAERCTQRRWWLEQPNKYRRGAKAPSHKRLTMFDTAFLDAYAPVQSAAMPGVVPSMSDILVSRGDEAV